jgi:hypothetical protein
MCGATFSRAMDLSGVLLSSVQERVLYLIFLSVMANFCLYTFCLLRRRSPFPPFSYVSFPLYLLFVFFPLLFPLASVLPTQDF